MDDKDGQSSRDITDGQSIEDGKVTQSSMESKDAQSSWDSKHDQSKVKDKDDQSSGDIKDGQSNRDDEDAQSSGKSKPAQSSGDSNHGQSCGERREANGSQETGGDAQVESETDLYKKNLSLLLGISEDSPLWENYDRAVNGDDDEDEGDERQDADEDDCSDAENGESSSEDLSDEESEGDDNWIQYSRKPFAFVTEEQCGRRRNHYLSPNNRLWTRSRSLVRSFPHLGCSKIDWRFVFSDTSVAVETMCYSPCKHRFILYEWDFSSY